MTHESLRLKINKIRRMLFASVRVKKIQDTNFTIISNNCWGGMVYESYNLQKLSPTIGCFFMANDFVKFVSDLRGYVLSELVFINPLDSMHAEVLKNYARFGEFPIGNLRILKLCFSTIITRKKLKKNGSAGVNELIGNVF